MRLPPTTSTSWYRVASASATSPSGSSDCNRVATTIAAGGSAPVIVARAAAAAPGKCSSGSNHMGRKGMARSASQWMAALVESTATRASGSLIASTTSATSSATTYRRSADVSSDTRSGDRVVYTGNE